MHDARGFVSWPSAAHENGRSNVSRSFVCPLNFTFRQVIKTVTGIQALVTLHIPVHRNSLAEGLLDFMTRHEDGSESCIWVSRSAHERDFFKIVDLRNNHKCGGRIANTVIMGLTMFTPTDVAAASAVASGFNDVVMTGTVRALCNIGVAN